ncbi:MAG: rhamnogalacturonan acetylesterase [Flavobacterium sp.]
MLVTAPAFAQKVAIYGIGDSTMADKKNPSQNPEHGWLQVFQRFVTADVKVINKAVNGRSTKSFIDEGRWDSITKVLKEGDYVFIQFGHNDQKTEDPKRYTNPHTAYRHNLMRFVNETRQKGAIPILFSSIARRNFNEQGVLVGTHGDYTLEASLVAAELNVPFIDLEYYTEVLEQSYGAEKSKELHLHFAPKEHPYYPEGKKDDTHLSEKGANEVAAIVARELKRVVPALGKFLR